MTTQHFPVGGKRQDVYNFLRDHGYVMSTWSDKEWTRADGVHLSVYGAGSMARVYDNRNVVIADAPIGEAVNIVQLATK